MFVARALSPAIVDNVTIEDEIAKVSLKPDQKAKAIGKNGINITLASMLTKHKIELVEKQTPKKSADYFDKLFSI